MKATRHCGRSGKHGAYNPKHNDRNFDLSNSDHIDVEKSKQNIYWDIYQGLHCFEKENKGDLPKMTFSEIESAFYYDKYFEFTLAQNERNEKARHPERNRSPDDILHNKKTCPEETLYQLGKIDESVSGEVLSLIALQFFNEFEEKYGKHIHILDWALHLDEGTPHIHERHVFDAENKYGELCPQQDEALKQLGFDLPNPRKSPGKYNNRKMTFDKVCRERFIEICNEHGVYPDVEPVYGGKTYLEKQDYIIAKQKELLKELGTQLDDISNRVKETEEKLSDENALIEEVSAEAYKKAVEVVTGQVSQITRQEDIEEIEKYEKWLSSDERTSPKEKRAFAIKRLEIVKDKIKALTTGMIQRVIETLMNGKVRDKNVEVVAEMTKERFKDSLAKAKNECKEINASLDSEKHKYKRFISKGIGD